MGSHVGFSVGMAACKNITAKAVVEQLEKLRTIELDTFFVGGELHEANTETGRRCINHGEIQFSVRHGFIAVVRRYALLGASATKQKERLTCNQSLGRWVGIPTGVVWFESHTHQA